LHHQIDRDGRNTTEARGGFHLASHEGTRNGNIFREFLATSGGRGFGFVCMAHGVGVGVVVFLVSGEKAGRCFFMFFFWVWIEVEFFLPEKQTPSAVKS